MLVTPEFWSALAAIVVIDLVLAGDNAIVIALALGTAAWLREPSVFDWRTPITLPFGPTRLAARKQSKPAPLPRSTTVSPGRRSAMA